MEPPSRPTASGPGGPAGAPVGRPAAGTARRLGAQHRLARLSQERVLALGAVAALVVLSGVGAGLLAMRGDDGAEQLARARRPMVAGESADADGSGDLVVPGVTSTTKPGGSTTTRLLTPVATRQVQTVATRRPGTTTGVSTTGGRTTTVPRTPGGDGGDGGGGGPVDPGGPGGPTDPGGPVDPGGPDNPGDPGSSLWGPLGPCAGGDFLPTIDVSSIRARYTPGQTVELNVGIRNVSDHECEPPPTPVLVISANDGTPLSEGTVDLPAYSGWPPNDTLRQLVGWKPESAGTYLLQVEVDGVVSDPLVLRVT